MSVLGLLALSLSVYIQEMGQGASVPVCKKPGHTTEPQRPDLSARVQHAPAVGWFARPLPFPCFRKQVGSVASSGCDCLESDPRGPEAFGE